MKKILEAGKDMIYGTATLPWDSANGVWRLPNGQVTKQKIIAIGFAKRLDRIISGKAKNERAV